MDNSTVIISSSGLRTAGDMFSLTCSVNLVDPFPLPSDIPTPRFEWSFNDTTSLPSDMTPTTMSSSTADNRTYTSILHFSPLIQSHIGTYTCRLGAGRLKNSVVVVVEGINSMIKLYYYCCVLQNLIFFHAVPTISIQITSSGDQILGQSGFTLTCTVNGAENLNSTVIFRWTKNNGSHNIISENDSRSLTFSPLKLSDAGQYMCQATVSSPYLSNNITVTDFQHIGIQSIRTTCICNAKNDHNYYCSYLLQSQFLFQSHFQVAFPAPFGQRTLMLL